MKGNNDNLSQKIVKINRIMYTNKNNTGYIVLPYSKTGMRINQNKILMRIIVGDKYYEFVANVKKAETYDRITIPRGIVEALQYLFNIYEPTGTLKIINNDESIIVEFVLDYEKEKKAHGGDAP